MPGRIRVGVVGASPQSWAAAAHLPALAHLGECTVTAVATSRQDSAREAAGLFGVRHAFASAEDLAAHPEVDLVVASVKVPAHAAVVRTALAAGKHVYAEWPLGIDLAEASALADAAEAAGVMHAVNLQVYHSPGARFVVIRPGMVYGDGGGLVHGLLTTKAAERGADVYVGPPGTRWPVVHVDDLATLYLAVVTQAAPGTIWHGAAETVRLDAIAAALGGGAAASWPVSQARAELGLLADLFTRDQDVSAAKTRAALGAGLHLYRQVPHRDYLA